MTFASNIFVDPATMPDFLQAVVGVNPVSHLVTALRALMDGQATALHILLAWAAPAVTTVIFGPVAMVLYRRQR
ncbi:hypothetical protein ACFOSD_11955 [Salinispirillum marinum]|uniref:ABC transmembrane type-2 domain-containing protein n=2 Tax=Saccharospirillaceae TaxID=255527 RepID=A0ABV8BFG5_9GAMM